MKFKRLLGFQAPVITLNPASLKGHSRSILFESVCMVIQKPDRVLGLAFHWQMEIHPIHAAKVFRPSLVLYVDSGDRVKESVILEQ